MNNIANEKGCISGSNGIYEEHLHGGGGISASTLSAYSYVHKTTPQLKVPVTPNAGPLGLLFFASTTFIVSMYNIKAPGITTPHAVISMACFSGGLAQVITGIWELYTGNLFGASALKVYGIFWMIYAALLYPGLGLEAAFADDLGKLRCGTGIFIAAWFIITFIFLLATLRVNLALVLVFFLLDMTFFFLLIGEFSASLTVHRVGGGFGVVTAFAAFYAGTAQLLTEDISLFTLPVGTISRRNLD